MFLPNFCLRCLDLGGIYHFGDGRTIVKLKGTTEKLLGVLSLWFVGETGKEINSGRQLRYLE